MKHLHMFTAIIAVGLFLYQAGLVFLGKNLILSRTFKGVSHLIYLLLIVSGLYLFWQLSQVAGAQHWVIAKAILLVVAISASVKALRNPALNQKRVGIIIAGGAYAAILVLAITKPMLSMS